MPLSQINIPVSNLPASCSFYLSSLAPLGYRCLGERGKDIAFGIDDVEFYLRQRDSQVETDPIKLNFTSFDRQSVNDFYGAALLAGASGRAQPTERRDETPYYEALVVDLDGNEIGTMYRPGMPLGAADVNSITKWQSDVARTAECNASHASSRQGPKIIINNITTTPAVDVHRIKHETNGDGEISTRAIIGTILGASAGAAVAFAMAKSESDKHREAQPQQTTYRAIEALPQRFTEVIYKAANSTPPSSGPIELIDREAEHSKSRHSGPPSLVKIVASTNRPDASIAKAGTASQDGRTVAGTKILAGDPERIPSSSKVSHATTVKKAESIKPQSSARSKSMKSAKDYPLPPSRVSTDLTPTRNKERPFNDLGTVVPDDSISQVSTKRSSDHHSKSSHRHHHHSRSGHTSKHRRESSHGSHSTVKA